MEVWIKWKHQRGSPNILSPSSIIVDTFRDHMSSHVVGSHHFLPRVHCLQSFSSSRPAAVTVFCRNGSASGSAATASLPHFLQVLFGLYV
ncbi:Hypothetical predicted protein [Prunus dulcis]|uniref:Uncharacterized protein n=1 Tax=Prunus dulcis TaxID=3755 RepID=A0A5E4EC77_PRUDU|nr:Hypothetical predicted protein [Prunus dulcis]